MLREDAYRLVQSHAMRAWKEDLIFRDEVARDPAIAKLLSAGKAGEDLRLYAAVGQCGCDLQAGAGGMRLEGVDMREMSFKSLQTRVGRVWTQKSRRLVLQGTRYRHERHTREFPWVRPLAF